MPADATHADRRDPPASFPLVSCLMVTLPVPERLGFARASIDAFCRQTFARRELVLVVNGGSPDVRRTLLAHVDSLGRGDIRVVVPPGEHKIGALRNVSLDHAAGDITCQWDDDDLHHPERLERQVEALMQGGHDAVLLQSVMQYFPRSGTLYWTNWQATPAGGHPGTLMARSTAPVRYAATGEQASHGEDLRVALALKARGLLGTIDDLPHLFVYVSHGANSWDAGHHRRLIEDLAISPGLLRRREAAIREGLRAFGFAAGTLQVMGRTGPAFQL
jgi:glycosyltransferase involved in cell wall biosynthesis